MGMLPAEEASWQSENSAGDEHLRAQQPQPPGGLGYVGGVEPLNASAVRSNAPAVSPKLKRLLRLFDRPPEIRPPDDLQAVVRSTARTRQRRLFMSMKPRAMAYREKLPLSMKSAPEKSPPIGSRGTHEASSTAATLERADLTEEHTTEPGNRDRARPVGSIVAPGNSRPFHASG